MKELDLFTVDRLCIIARSEGLEGGVFLPSTAEMAALARIALAAKTAEPVGNLIQDESCFSGMVGHIHVELITKSGDIKNNGTVALLYAAPALKSPETPDGWVMVPKVPTEEMIVDGFESEPDKYFSDKKEWKEYQNMSGCQQAAHRAKLCWDAMLAAAPKPEK